MLSEPVGAVDGEALSVLSFPLVIKELLVSLAEDVAVEDFGASVELSDPFPSELFDKSDELGVSVELDSEEPVELDTPDGLD